MKAFHLVFLFYFIILKTGVCTVNITISSSHNLPVKLGEKVFITCKLSNVIQTNVPLLYFNKEEMMSEGCSVFKKDLYNLSCKDNKEYTLEIKHMSWNDKGKWKCMYSDQTKHINLDIFVPSKVSMSINSIPGKISSSNMGLEAFPMKHESYASLKGRGIKLNPFDLRNNVTVSIKCFSECGYPKNQHMYIFRNTTNFTLKITSESFKYEVIKCDVDKNTSSSISILKLNCLQMQLGGLINLSCETFHKYENGNILFMSEHNIFILCPTDPVKWWKMTYGEMINTGIGCMIGLMLLMFLCLMLCRWKSYKHKNNYDSCQDDSGDKIGRGYKV